MNITNKIKKASAVRDKEAYMRAANNRFGFKVEGKGTFIWTSEEAENLSSAWKPIGTYSNRCVRLEVKSYELKVVGENHFWVVTELDGTVLIIDEIEFTKSYYYGKRSKKAKATDFLPPHKCFGYWTDFCDKVKAIEEKDLAEMEAEGDTGRLYKWYIDRNILLEETFN
ncbi:hypothetical protein OAO24_05470 [Methylophilaceae bacterium]|nr:hypothetical protein [Methylophilaceae bacterium]|tara:strand:- start:317 stop:823 length:507 start_codon:yes stop_codon:yes gene_type:complete